MAIFSPYRIKHILLDSREEFLKEAPNEGENFYYVFWWKKIPLGHLYWDEHQKPEQLGEKILEAILPSLTYYIPNQEHIYRLKPIIEGKDFLELSSILDPFFDKYQATKSPLFLDLSVVICTRNRSENLKTCLKSISSLQYPPNEIIVIDNAPEDSSTQEVTNLFPHVTYYKEERPGLDIARNTGAKLAHSNLIAYTDDDVSVDPLWSYRVWETFSNPEIDAMTGLVLASQIETESQFIFEKFWGFNRGYQDVCYNSDFIYKSDSIPRVWEIGAGANMAFRKSAIESVNYFDDRLDVGAAGCSGDSEIWFRILAKGMKMQYNPRAIVFHEHRQEINQLQKQLYNYMRGHAASVLIQHNQLPKIGYDNYLYFEMSKYYLFLIRMGFPHYNLRYRTVWSEIKGLLSGIRFFQKHKNKSTLSSQSNG
ncbi:glycosyltransferase [Algoriphagus chordae]|uniref:GT2 family glycosyltransferase n=1 Tax=Algoriphagus chordae TaxID=237019 RepID=A0A2W7QQ89_9BACT|nr:glycosyltransferase family 2 protein [Algoriphagus chordae]PZX50514.1 GT2 family glycosyltransferase [Algoriphagus chordae]